MAEQLQIQAANKHLATGLTAQTRRRDVGVEVAVV
jgi:hypothetical protein